MNHYPRLIIVWMGCLLLGGVGFESPAAVSPVETRYHEHSKLAAAALREGHYGLARTNLLAAHELLLPAGFKSPFFPESLGLVAGFYYARGKPYLSRRYADTLREHYLVRKGTNSMEAAYACFLFGQVQRELHQFKLAEKSLLESLAIAEKEAGEDSLVAAHAKARLGQLYVWMQQDAKAIEYLEPGLKRLAAARGLDKVKEFQRVSVPAFHHPNITQEAELIVEYVLALNAVGRKEEGTAKLKLAERLHAQVDSKTSAKFHVLKQAGCTLEARGDWRAAEEHFYAAAQRLWSNEKLSKRDQLRGTELVLEFHVRNGQDAKSSAIEGVLFGAGISPDYLDELNVRCERLSYARDGGPHKRY